MNAPNEFEEYWDFLKDTGLVLVTNQASDFKSQIEIARVKTAFDLETFTKGFLGKELTSEILGTVVSKFVATFLTNWRAGLRDQSILGLIEVILEDDALTPEELKNFLKALPFSLLSRLVDHVSGNATGVHAILAIEMRRRSSQLPDYDIGKESGRFYVEFVDSKTQGLVRVFTDDFFKV